uniref:MHC class I antigen n=1 Tax=Romanomermis culicivorax TaxID=13658 RepID=A0A915J3T4_ROMCU
MDYKEKLNSCVRFYKDGAFIGHDTQLTINDDSSLQLEKVAVDKWKLGRECRQLSMRLKTLWRPFTQSLNYRLQPVGPLTGMLLKHFNFLEP